MADFSVKGGPGRLKLHDETKFEFMELDKLSHILLSCHLTGNGRDGLTMTPMPASAISAART